VEGLTHTRIVPLSPRPNSPEILIMMRKPLNFKELRISIIPNVCLQLSDNVVINLWQLKALRRICIRLLATMGCVSA
jgi:hypothetical protein